MSDIAVAESGKQKPQAGNSLFRPKKRRSVISIDMTPMVDVAFLLLIFFMVTTVFRRPLAMEVNMPEPGAKVEVPESNVMTVYVDQDESLYFKLGTGALAKASWAELAADFRSFSAANPELIVLVKIHRKARYEPMVDMMDTLEDCNMQRFSLIPMKEGEDAVLEGVR